MKPGAGRRGNGVSHQARTRVHVQHVNLLAGEDIRRLEQGAVHRDAPLVVQIRAVLFADEQEMSLPAAFDKLPRLERSIADLQQNFNKTPVAIIWPGGGFGVRPVQMARQLGYKLGFTVNPRGPLMFNWIPQADADDPANQYDIAEGPVGDPLLTLPRYWDTDAASKLDEIRIMGNEAAAYAEQVKPVELDYYDIVCAPTLGPIPAAIP